MGDRDMLVVFSVYLLLSSGSSLRRIARGGAGLSLRYRPSPGFHQKVGIGSLPECVSFLVRVSVQNQIPLVLASIVLVYDSVSALL